MIHYGMNTGSTLIHMAYVSTETNRPFPYCGAGLNYAGQTWRSESEFYLIEAQAPTCKKCLNRYHKEFQSRPTTEQ
jgi:hypothetical protein